VEKAAQQLRSPQAATYDKDPGPKLILEASENSAAVREIFCPIAVNAGKRWRKTQKY